VERGFIATVSSAAKAAAFAAFGTVRVNFKIDTGMGRAGCNASAAGTELERLVEVYGVRVHSVSTHLPCADEDSDFTRHQLEIFQNISGLARQFFPGVLRHSLNSAGILLGGFDQADLVRPGLLLYGVSPRSEAPHALHPALSWKARVVLTRLLPAGSSVSYGRDFTTPKDLPAAIVAVGYADGFPRHLSGRGACVIIRGVRCPVLGRVTMDQIVVDTSQVPGVESGDVAVLIGKDGKECLTAEEMADRAGTISWDILTGLGRRVAHVPFSGSGMAFASSYP
jgi:alanine racemase